MKQWLITGWLLLGAALLVTGIVTQWHGHPRTPQPAYGFVQNVYGERVTWKTNKPIPLYVHESFPQNMYPALQNAIHDWEVALHRPVFEIIAYGIQNPATPAQDGVNVVYWMSSWENEKSAEQARTSVYWISDRISEADIRINAKDNHFYLDTPVTYSDVHLESLLVHELGHVLGLKHRDDSGSVMATYLASQTIRTNIAPVDIENVNAVYQYHDEDGGLKVLASLKNLYDR